MSRLPATVDLSAAPVAQSDRTSWTERLGFASGTLPYNFGTGIITLAYPIYNITLGMSPTLIGVVLAMSRLWDGCLDPMVGSASDNFRSKWGRRRPFIAVGAVLCGLIYPLIWFVPTHWSEMRAFGYFLVTTLVFYTAFAVYSVPYSTLGYEMSTDSNERVRITAVRAFVSKFTFFILPWIFSAAQLPYFKSTIAGMRFIGVIMGILFIVLAIPSVLLTRERYAKQAVKQVKVPIREGLRLTLQNRPFLYLEGIVLGLLIGTNMVNQLGIYVNSYYVFAGNTAAGAALQAKAQTLYAFAGMATIPIVTRMATRHGKLRVIRWCIVLGIIASISKYFCYSRAIPELQYLSMLLLSPAFSGFWVLVEPMKADSADYDEHVSGLRREGMYAAVGSWLEKTALTATMLGASILLDLSGFNVARGGAQDETTLQAIRLGFAGVPTLLLCGSLFLSLRYPLPDDRVKLIKNELTQRHAPAV